MSEAAVNGTTLYYERAGSGVPCLVLHGGLGLDHSYMKTMLEPLHDVLDVTYFDMRSNGRSGRPPLETMTMEQLAADADALRSHLGLERVAVVGHSYGGFVALEHALRYPDTVSHLLLVATSPGVFEPTDDELMERPDDRSATPVESGAGGAMPTTDEEFAQRLPVLAEAYVWSIPPEDLLARIGGGIMSVAALARSMQILDGWSVAERLHAIAAPTLVVAGRYDRFCPAECARRIGADIPNAEVIWLERSGHFPWLEEPEAFSEGVRDFFRRNP